jgi:long-chain-fatty-acid--CoA ligase ACSBG
VLDAAELHNEHCLSYLTLSHVAVQITDIIGSISGKACLNFADDRALQGTLGDTLKEVRPSLFMGVPRVFEKIEEKIKAAAGASSSWLKTKLVTWAKEIGFEATLAHLNHKPAPCGTALRTL